MKTKRITELLDVARRMGTHLGGTDVPIQRAVIFLLIAAAGEEGAESKDLKEAAGLAASSVSRNVAALGEWPRGKKGLGLVKTRTDYTDRRRKPVVLTAKGQRVLNELIGG